MHIVTAIEIDLRQKAASLNFNDGWRDMHRRFTTNIYWATTNLEPGATLKILVNRHSNLSHATELRAALPADVRVQLTASDPDTASKWIAELGGDR